MKAMDTSGKWNNIKSSTLTCVKLTLETSFGPSTVVSSPNVQPPQPFSDSSCSSSSLSLSECPLLQLPSVSAPESKSTSLPCSIKNELT